MPKLSMSVLFLLYLAVAHGMPAKKQDSVDTRKPVYIRGRCPPNQLLYPGDQPDSWYCDCGAGFLYHARDDKCYRIYKKGPCANGQYFILQGNKQDAECVNNPCAVDGSVPFKGTCATLYSSSPCPPANSGQVLGVNYDTLELTCVEGGASLNIINPPSNSCPRGSKRNSSGQCRREFPISD